MKIRGESNITIAEWSHNGAFRLWVDSEKSPQLHKLSYSGYQLRRNSNERQVHIGSRWVYKIQKMIENYTGLQIR